ncbi:MAG: glycosyltransferase family 87 protein [Ignavibacteriaceae bacterium]
MFLFLPLGYFNFNEARLLWLVISFLFFILDVYLIWKLFFYFNKKIGLYLSFLILVILSASFTTFTLGQTLFIALFFLMLYWRKQNSNLSGLWIALSILVKPFFGIILIFLLIRKKWKVLFSSLLSLTALLFLSIIVFGYSTFIHYFTHITHIDVPNWQYTGLENQSLLATLIRNFGHDFTASSPLLNIYYIIIAAVISILTFSIIYFLPKDKNEIGIAFIVSLALLIYPGSLNIYGVVLLPGILFLNLKKKELSISNLLLLTYILLFFSLMRFQAFISYLITWILLLIVGIKIVVPLLTKLNSKNV